MRVHSAGRSADLLLFFVFFKKSQRRAQSLEHFTVCCRFCSLFIRYTVRDCFARCSSEARFLLLKRFQFARSERLEVKPIRRIPMRKPEARIQEISWLDFLLCFVLLFSRLLKQSAMKMFVVFTVCMSVVVLASAQADQKVKNCNEVRTAYSSKGFNVNDVPNKGVHGELHCFY